MKSPKQLKGRLALVTGATRGLGRAVALAFAREGAQVIICGRTEGALEEVDDEIRGVGGKATILKLDLRAGDRIDQLGPTLYQRFGKLDIVVAAAGILGPLSPLPHVTAEAWNAVIDINLNANWRLIRTLDPLLRLSDAGRAIFVTCGAADAATAYWGPHSVSKVGLETLAKTYAAEVATTNIQVGIVDPGPMRTALRTKAFPGEDPLILATPDDVAPLFVDVALPSAAINGEIVRFKTWKRSQGSLASNSDA
jgi:NAD(P)-dependent dehydrogenase (short-subunit alcohol dehydrogenase family)